MARNQDSGWGAFDNINKPPRPKATMVGNNESPWGKLDNINKPTSASQHLNSQQFGGSDPYAGLRQNLQGAGSGVAPGTTNFAHGPTAARATLSQRLGENHNTMWNTDMPGPKQASPARDYRLHMITRIPKGRGPVQGNTQARTSPQFPNTGPSNTKPLSLDNMFDKSGPGKKTKEFRPMHPAGSGRKSGGTRQFRVSRAKVYSVLQSMTK